MIVGVRCNFLLQQFAVTSSPGIIICSVFITYLSTSLAATILTPLNKTCIPINSYKSIVQSCSIHVSNITKNIFVKLYYLIILLTAWPFLRLYAHNIQQNKIRRVFFCTYLNPSLYAALHRSGKIIRGFVLRLCKMIDSPHTTYTSHGVNALDQTVSPTKEWEN